MYNSREIKYEWDELYLKCTVCWERKTKDDFHNCKKMKFWLKSKCKECNKLSSREYRKSHKDVVKRYNYSYRVANRDNISSYEVMRNKKKSEDLWFNWAAFHDKAKIFVRSHKLRPSVCPMCWEGGKIEMHHPSYTMFEDRSNVVFCCTRCHRNIHVWNIKCPEPINLLELV